MAKHTTQKQQTRWETTIIVTEEISTMFGKPSIRKKTGEFFLYGEGGPLSKYAVSEGQNSWSGGEKIIPLSFDSAKEWAEEKLDSDDYIKIFGEPEEDGSKQYLNLYLKTSTVTKIKQEAAKQDMTVSEYIEHILG